MLRIKSRPMTLSRFLARSFSTHRILCKEAGFTEAQALTFSRFGEPADVLRLTRYKVSHAKIGSDDILLRTLAAPINPADINTIQGTYGALPNFDHEVLGTAATSLDTPSAVPGNEGVFEVMELGSNAKSTYETGDWLIPLKPGIGSWRSHLLTKAGDSKFMKVPKEIRAKGLLPIHAALVTVNPLTALKLITEFGTRWDESSSAELRGLRAGDWLLQNGANSAVGRLVIQLAKKHGFKTLNVVRARENEDQTKALQQELEALGADIVVTDAQLGRELSKQLQVATGGKGANLMLDCVGGKAAIALSRCLNEGSEVVTYGAMSKQPMTPGAGMLIFKDIRFRGFWVSRWGNREPEKKKKALCSLLGMLADSEIKLGATTMVPWNSNEQRLLQAVAQTLTGYKAGKDVFDFGDFQKSDFRLS